MLKYENLLRLLLEHENILEESLEKNEHIIEDEVQLFDNYFLFNTSKKEWNLKIIESITNLKNEYKKNIKTFDKDFLLSIRFLIEIYNQKFSRIDSFDQKKANMMIQEYYLGPNYSKINNNMHEFVHESLKFTKLMIESIINYSDNNKKELDLKLKDNIFDEDVTEIINLTCDEVVTDYSNSCFISAISLCGKIIETALYALLKKYEPNYSYDSTDKRGLYQLYNKLNKHGYDFSDVEKQIAIIATHRNMAIHGNIIRPDIDDALGTIHFTKSVLNRIMSRQ